MENYNISMMQTEVDLETIYMGPGEENIIFSLHYRIMLRKIYKNINEYVKC